MLSFLQYRRAGLAVKKQVRRDHAEGGRRISTISQILKLEAPKEGRRQGSTSSSSTSRSSDDEAIRLGRIGTTATIATIRTRNSLRTALGHALRGINARDRTTHEGKGEMVFVVNWDGENDPLNPRNWSLAYRALTTLGVSFLFIAVGAASSADTSILPQAAAEFGVSDVVESMSIGTLDSLRFVPHN